MAAYIPVPRDLTRVKTKVFFNLTKRQLLCFGAAALIGVPIFFLVKATGNVSLAALSMMIVMLLSAKLDRIGADLEKARKKRAEWDAKVKDLERRYREEENSEIHEMVHAANLNPEQLSELLRMFAADMAPKPDTINTMNEEETQNEI